MSETWQQEASTLQRSLSELCKDLHAYSHNNPAVEGAAKLARRARKELAFTSKLHAQIIASRSSLNSNNSGNAIQQCPAHAAAPATADSPGKEATADSQPDLIAEQVQGARNNLHGLRAELDTAMQAPGVIAVNKKFSKQVHSGPGKGSPAAEVDVVAQNGSTWIEVKCHESVDIRSASWTGGATRKGMQQQAEHLAAVAQEPCNHILWQAPQLVFHFTSSLDQGIAAELRALGAIVTGPGPLAAALLPPPPAPPAATNLDVTTLCGLVSEVSHCRIGDSSTLDAVQNWASRVSHWQECWDAEISHPLLDELAPYLHRDRPLWACPGAVSQMQALVETYGGPLEQARWEVLKARLHTGDSDQLNLILQPESTIQPGTSQNRPDQPGDLCDQSRAELQLGASKQSAVPQWYHDQPAGQIGKPSTVRKPHPKSGQLDKHPGQLSALMQPESSQQSGIHQTHADQPPSHSEAGHASTVRQDQTDTDGSANHFKPGEPIAAGGLPSAESADSCGQSNQTACMQPNAYLSATERGDAPLEEALELRQSSGSTDKGVPVSDGPSRLSSNSHIQALQQPCVPATSGGIPGNEGHEAGDLSAASNEAPVQDTSGEAPGIEGAEAGRLSAARPQAALQTRGRALRALPAQEPEAGGLSAAQAEAAVQARSRALERRVGRAQREVFVMGDVARAVTLTANARAAHSVQAAGLNLPMHVHRAVWLTGL